MAKDKTGEFAKKKKHPVNNVPTRFLCPNFRAKGIAELSLHPDV
jgi:hypothetical protein